MQNSPGYTGSVNYLYEIVKRKDNELVKRIYTVKKYNPTKGDFVCLVEEDLKMISEDINHFNKFQLLKRFLETI